jgi:hypothetical protein
MWNVHLFLGERSACLSVRVVGERVTAERVTAELIAREDGCVIALVDGIERVPLWPPGTAVTHVSDQHDPAMYRVTLQNSKELMVNSRDTVRITAPGILADTTGPFEDPPGKVDSFLTFCDVESSPVAFPEADGFEIGH